MEKKKILLVTQELSPFIPKSDIASFTKRIPQSIQDAGKDIRIFTPKFGSINERRHQLHEVIRLSGMNIIIDDRDHPLLIKVASIPTVRLQVYFIDNEEFFDRKHLLKDENEELFKDNDERAMFFCRGVLETVKKLGWKPDVVFCHGEMSYFMPLYLKKIFHKDPHFNDSKVVLSLYNDENKAIWDERLIDKLKFEGFDKKFLQEFQDLSYENIMRNIFKMCDGLIIGDPMISETTTNLFNESNCYKQEFIPEENQSKVLSEFFDKVIEDKVLV